MRGVAVDEPTLIASAKLAGVVGETTAAAVMMLI